MMLTDGRENARSSSRLPRQGEGMERAAKDDRERLWEERRRKNRELASRISLDKLRERLAEASNLRRKLRYKEERGNA